MDLMICQNPTIILRNQHIWDFAYLSIIEIILVPKLLLWYRRTSAERPMIVRNGNSRIQHWKWVFKLWQRCFWISLKKLAFISVRVKWVQGGCQIWSLIICKNTLLKKNLIIMIKCIWMLTADSASWWKIKGFKSEKISFTKPWW